MARNAQVSGHSRWWTAYPKVCADGTPQFHVVLDRPPSRRLVISAMPLGFIIPTTPMVAVCISIRLPAHLTTGRSLSRPALPAIVDDPAIIAASPCRPLVSPLCLVRLMSPLCIAPCGPGIHRLGGPSINRCCLKQHRKSSSRWLTHTRLCERGKACSQFHVYRLSDDTAVSCNVHRLLPGAPLENRSNGCVGVAPALAAALSEEPACAPLAPPRSASTSLQAASLPCGMPCSMCAGRTIGGGISLVGIPSIS